VFLVIKELTARLAVLLGLAIRFSKSELHYLFIISAASACRFVSAFFLFIVSAAVCNHFVSNFFGDCELRRIRFFCFAQGGRSRSVAGRRFYIRVSEVVKVFSSQPDPVLQPGQGGG
jgi:hypothetical protein